jgi:hypothetical protein
VTKFCISAPKFVGVQYGTCPSRLFSGLHIFFGKFLDPYFRHFTVFLNEESTDRNGQADTT